MGEERECSALSAVLNTSHPTQRLHSQLDNTRCGTSHAIADREAILIHPDDARTRSAFRTGDLVRASSERGRILVARCSPKDIRPGVVRICAGGLVRSGQARRGRRHHARTATVNCLTFDEGSSSLAQGNCGHMAAVADRVKYSGPDLVNTAHEVPVNA